VHSSIGNQLTRTEPMGSERDGLTSPEAGWGGAHESRTPIPPSLGTREPQNSITYRHQSQKRSADGFAGEHNQKSEFTAAGDAKRFCGPAVVESSFQV